MKVFDIEEKIKDLGFDIYYLDTKDFFLIAGNKEFRFRAIQYQDIFQVAKEKDFDRWANSVDFEFKFPYTHRAFDEILKGINK